MWSMHYRRDVDLLGHIQGRTKKKIIQGMEHLPYQYRLRGERLLRLEKRKKGTDSLAGCVVVGQRKMVSDQN